MTQIKVELTIDATNGQQVDALNLLITALGGPEAKKASTRKSKTETPKSAKAEAEKEASPAKEVVEKEEVKEETPEAASKYTKDDVRGKVSLLQGDHRTAIKEKLTSIGAKNVSLMDDDKVDEFMEFLIGLENE